MLAYPIDEAEELLDAKLSGAMKSLENCEEDLDFLREQITVGTYRGSSTSSAIRRLLITYPGSKTMEVAIARVYNWDVVQKRKERAEAEKNSKKGTGDDGKGGPPND